MFLNFLRDNWKVILEVLLLVISFMIIVFRKKTKIIIPDSVLSELYANLPNWIDQAEELVGPGKGDRKLQEVLKKALYFLCNEIGIAMADIPASLSSHIIEQIEAILSTPQKKGVIL